MPEIRHIVILAPNWLGDAVMALPAIADVRRAYPDAELTVAARPSVAGLLALASGVSRVLTLESDARWWKRAPRRRDADTIRALGADVAILLPNSYASARLVANAGVPERWGYSRDRRAKLLTRAVPRPSAAVHQIGYYQHLTTELGCPCGPGVPRLDVPPHVRAAAAELLRARGWDGVRPVIVFAPGAAYGRAKQWLPSHVAALVSMQGLRATCALVGSRADAPTTAAIASRTPAIDLAGATTLAELAGVLALAAVCVCNDSGAMHLAAAVGTSIVATFGPTREDETGPRVWGGAAAEVLMEPVWCRPCMLRECPIDHRCMARITPERAAASVDRILARSAA